MAIFDLYDRESTQGKKDITLTCFKVMAGADYPTLEINVNDATRKVERDATKKYSNLEIHYKKGGHAVGKLIDEPAKYCKDVLEASCTGSKGLYDEHDLKKLLKKIQELPKFAKHVAGKLAELFQSAALFAEEEEAELEKN